MHNTAGSLGHPPGEEHRSHGQQPERGRHPDNIRWRTRRIKQDEHQAKKPPDQQENAKAIPDKDGPDTAPQTNEQGLNRIGHESQRDLEQGS